jgi:hypothetical protein
MFGQKRRASGTEREHKTALRQGERWMEVQGTFAYEDAVKRAKKRHRHADAVGVLVPVTEGKYKGAVSVCIDGTQLGSLPAAAAPEFYPVVMELKQKRKRATVLLDFSDPEGDRRGIYVAVCAEPSPSA